MLNKHLPAISAIVFVKPKFWKIYVCCLSAKHVALRCWSQNWLTGNQDIVSGWGWSNMSIQWASSTMKIKYGVGLIMDSILLTITCGFRESKGLLLNTQWASFSAISLPEQVSIRWWCLLCISHKNNILKS